MLQLFVNGPPGAGKTSLCKRLSELLGVEHVATGDVLRDNIVHKSQWGLIAKECISNKALVPDAIVVEMVAERICASSGWILDGFPRTTEQCAALRRKQIVPTVAIVLELPERECIKRITGRRFDPITRRIYHSPCLMPSDATIRNRLTKRSDDASDKFPPRMDAYRMHGEQINAFFQSIAHHIDANQPLEAIVSQVQAILKAPYVGQTIDNNNKLVSRPETITEEEDHEEEDDSLDSIRYDQDDDLLAKKLVSTSVIITDDELQRMNQPQQGHQGQQMDQAESSQTTSTSDLDDQPTNASTSKARLAAAQPQQDDASYDMQQFKDMLMDGFEVVKHGRRGSPHARLVYTDMDFKRIFWQKPSKDNRTKRAKLDQSLALGDVVQVVRGIKTDVLRRSGDVSKYERYLSLVADDRTLDMELPNDAMGEFLLHGFEQLLLSRG